MKAQAALEFIMTYGWAILAVLVAIGALAYFGVLSGIDPPEHCIAAPGFNCYNYAVFGNPGGLQIQFSLENDIGEQATVLPSQMLSYTDGLPADCQESGKPPGNVTMQNGETKNFICLMAFGNPGKNKNVKLGLNFTYMKSSGAYPHTFSGEMLTKVR